MKNIIRTNLLLVLLFVAKSAVSNNVISFEGTAVPTNITVSNGTLSLSDYKSKLGDKSLKWDRQSNSIITINRPDRLSAASQKSAGGFSLWIYNSIKSDSSIDFAFLDENNTEKCSISFQLAYTGWRRITVRFREDMSYTRPYTILSKMLIKSPTADNSPIYIDYLEFLTDIPWDRCSDFQYMVNQTNDKTHNFLEVRNTPAPAPEAMSDEQRKATAQIEERLNLWYLGTNKYNSDPIFSKRLSGLNAYIKRAKDKTGSLNLIKQSDGTIKGVGLFPVTEYGKVVDNVSLTTFRTINETYLLQLAYDYKYNNQLSSLNMVKDILNWYSDQGWADGSALGAIRFEMLRSAGFFHSIFLVKDALTDSEYEYATQALYWYALTGKIYLTENETGTTADELRTLAIPKLIYALSIKDESGKNTALQSLQSYLQDAYSFAPGFRGVLKPDYSGYHHHGVYNSAYYPEALYVGCLLYYLLDGTPYALGPDVYNNLKNALLTFRFFSGEYNVPASTTGRLPIQQTIVQTLLPAFAYLGLNNQDQELRSAFKRLWKPNEEPVLSYIQKVSTHIAFTSTLGELELLLDFNTKTGGAEENPSGTLFMPYSGLLVARKPNWHIAAKGFSKYIWDYESSSTENLYGRYLSYGHIEYTDLANGKSSYNAAHADWNWSHIPGTTSKYLSLENLNYNATNGKHRNFSDHTFLGGIALNSNIAMFTNQIHDNAFDNSFYANKSVFVFGNYIYCMGSDIQTTDKTTPVYTTLFQNIILPEETLKVNDAIYQLIFPEQVNTKSSSRSVIVTPGTEEPTSGFLNPNIKDNYGNWYFVYDGLAKFKGTPNMVVNYIDHGTPINKTKYNYGMLIKPVNGEEDYYKRNNPIQVISQNSKAHIIYNENERVVAMSVFDSSTPLDIHNIHSVSKPMLVMLRKNIDNTFLLAFSDPDMNRGSAMNSDEISNNIAKEESKKSSINVVLNGSFNLVNGDKDIEAVLKDGKTIITYPYACDGQTYKAILKATTQSSQSTASSKNTDDLYINIIHDNLKIGSKQQSSFNFNLVDIYGKTIKKGRSDSEIVMPLKSIPPGVIVICAEAGTEVKTMKILNTN